MTAPLDGTPLVPKEACAAYFAPTFRSAHNAPSTCQNRQRQVKKQTAKRKSKSKDGHRFAAFLVGVGKGAWESTREEM